MTISRGAPVLRWGFSKTFLGIIFLSLVTTGAGQSSTPTGLPRWGPRTLSGEPAAKLFLDRFGNFRAAGPAMAPKPEFMASFGNDKEANVAASRPYISNDGQRLWLTIIKIGSDSAAYALLTEAKHSLESSQAPSG